MSASRNAAADMRLQPGAVIDERFVVREWLGAGAFGDVYRAEQLLFGRAVRHVALKVFKAERVTSDNVASVFADAITLFGLMEDDPPPEVASRMVQVYDVGLTRAPFERGYIAMRLVHGGRSLASEIRRFRAYPMPVETSLWYLSRLLVPLAWLHRQDQPLVHGDLKPENVLLTEKHDIVLTDFGLAARLPLGAAGGTVAYDAPEVLLHGVGTPAADIYSLGVAWYEMLAGRHPFADVGLEALAENRSDAYRRAHHEARKRRLGRADAGANEDAAVFLPSPARYNDDLRKHPQIEALLERCLAYRASERFANARLLLDEIERYAKTGAIRNDVIEPAVVQPATQEGEPPHGDARVKTPEARVADALALITRGEAVQALATVQEVLAGDAKFAPALSAQSKALLALGRIADAQRILGPAYQQAPEDPVLMAAYADVIEAQGQRSLAQSLRQRAEVKRQRERGQKSRSER